jgi:phosphatidylserine/phosphatidylglycerophosphate/cardiolipin synthase-like enzyme
VIALRSARDHVEIEAPYFNPTDWLADEILQTAARGVRVRILTNSSDSVDIPSAYFVTASYFRPMIDGGVEIYLWNKKGHTMHSKAMVVDDRLGMLGSYNFNYRSIVWDTECVVTFTDPETVGRIQTMINTDLDPNNIITVDQAWIDAQPADDQSLWKTANDFSLFF